MVSFSVGLGPSDSQRPGDPVPHATPAAILGRLPLGNACKKEEGGRVSRRSRLSATQSLTCFVIKDSHPEVAEVV